MLDSILFNTIRGLVDILCVVGFIHMTQKWASLRERFTHLDSQVQVLRHSVREFRSQNVELKMKQWRIPNGEALQHSR